MSKRGWIVAALSAALTLVLALPGFAQYELDHFKVYEVKPVDVKARVTTQGQFNQGHVRMGLRQLVNFANPVVKDRGVILDKNAHLTWYSIETDEKAPDPVTVKNQFGRQKLVLGPPVGLLAPALKKEEGFEFPKRLDHFKVYKVLRGEPAGRGVMLKDQFDREQQQVEVRRPVFFAVPVEKRHGRQTFQIHNKRDHLTFYEITPKGYDGRVSIGDQFHKPATIELSLRRSFLLGVPTHKEEPEGEFKLDHFKVYKIRIDRNQAVSTAIGLQGQFEKRPLETKIEGPYLLANPVSKNGSRIYDGNAHMTVYFASRSKPEPQRLVDVRNQITGFRRPEQLVIGDPKVLLVPTAKRQESKTFPVSEKLDHFLCYEVLKVVDLIAEKERPRIRRVALIDQFEKSENLVAKPLFFGVPVSKLHEGNPSEVKNSKDHLVIYELQRHPSEPVAKIGLADQFGKRDAEVYTRMWLCVPTEKLKVTVVACPQDPPLNSALAVHGNTDWHIDTAHEFLFGTDMAGTATAANHCPDTWTRRHQHVGLTNTNHFYYDKDLTTPGDDTDATNGIEPVMLFFYAGHGSPTSWDTLGNTATQQYMRLADCPGGGRLRYYWQCSCEVFAHGPKDCPGQPWDYSLPGDFDGSADSVTMRNVYERWGPVLAPPLRMACGASTPAYCHEWVTDRVWNNYNNLGMDVADSWIDGLNWNDVVPLCLTMGGADVSSTPLFDTAFTNADNRSGTSHYHIQYASTFASTPRVSGAVAKEIPKELPILELGPTPEPKASMDPLPSTRSKTGALLRALGKPAFNAKAAVLSERQYIQHAQSLLKRQGWTEELVAEPVGTKHMLQTVPVKGEKGKIRNVQKNVIVRFRRRIKVGDTLVPVVGEGGQIGVQMNNDGSVITAWKVWRALVRTDNKADRVKRVKTYQQALKEATAKLKAPRAYKLQRWTWGYKELAGNVRQKEMRIVFRFAFAPVNEEIGRRNPPRLIEIPGQVD